MNTGQWLDLQGPADRAALAEAARLVLAETEALRLRIADTPAGPRRRRASPRR